MQPTYDNSSTGNSGAGGTTLSWSHVQGNLGSLGMIVVGFEAEYFGASGTVSSATYNGQAMTFIGRNSGSGSHTSVVEFWAIWGTSVPAAGTYTISVTWGASANSLAGGAMSFKFLKAQTAEASATTSGSGTNPSTSLTTLTKNALLCTIYGSQNTPSATSTTGDTRAFNSVPGSGEQSECDGFYRLVSSPGSASVSLTVSNPEGEAMVIAAFTFQGVGGLFDFL